MATPRRMGTETSETRFRLLDITEKVMIEDGYAAVSSRRIAKEAGVTAALVHYYFATLDDLFLEVLRRRAKQQLERQERFLSSDQPLRALWSFASEQAGTALLLEFMALPTPASRSARSWPPSPTSSASPSSRPCRRCSTSTASTPRTS